MQALSESMICLQNVVHMSPQFQSSAPHSAIVSNASLVCSMIALSESIIAVSKSMIALNESMIAFSKKYDCLG